MTSTDPNNSKLFVFDCDSTIIQDEVIELIAAEAGSYELVAEITERAMRGELDFDQSLAARVETFAGLDASALDRVRERVKLTRGVTELIAKIHAEKGYVAIVSGGFHEILDDLASGLKADVWLANRLEIVDGKLTGRTVGETVNGAVKARMLKTWAAKYGIEQAQTVAVGDGANDIPMMREAGTSVAFNAKPIVREVADHAVQDDLARVIHLIY